MGIVLQKKPKYYYFYYNIYEDMELRVAAENKKDADNLIQYRFNELPFLPMDWYYEHREKIEYKYEI